MINKYFLEEPNILDLSKEIFNAVVDQNLKVETRFELISKNIEDAEFPNGLRVGLIKKDDKIIIPDKETKIEINYEILFLCMSEDIKKAEELFQVRSEY